MDAAQLFGYYIVEELGRGPLAIVYRARRESDGQEVALKFTRPGLVQDASLFARLSRETEALNLLEQPGILPVIEINEQDGQIQIATPLMAAGNLESRLGAGPLPLDSTVRLVERLAKALDTAHSAGFLHLDLKPANVLFDEENQAWLSDFSGHKLAQACLEPTPLTIYGPLAYISPEQFMTSSVVDERADVYSLGVLLFHMLNGEPPFYSENALGYLEQHRSSALPPLPRPFPEWLHSILAKAMAYDPDVRYLTASALADDLRLGLQGNVERLSISTHPNGPTMNEENVGDLYRRQIKPSGGEKPPGSEDGKRSDHRRRGLPVGWVYRFLSLMILLIGAGLLLRFFPGGIEKLDILTSQQMFKHANENVTTQHPTFIPGTEPVVAQSQTLASPTRPASIPSHESIAEIDISLPSTDIPSSESQMNQPLPTFSPSVPLTYTLQYNDNLFSIAAAYNLDLSYLIAVNNLQCDSRLYPNKVIQLPPPSQDKFPSGLQGLTSENFQTLQWERILECTHNVSELSFSPDGSTLAVAQENDIYLWKVGEWIPFKLLRGHLSKISSIAYTSDGRLLASAANDLRIRLWSMEDYSNIATINAHGSEIKNIAISPDNKRLVSTSTDLTVKIWEIPSGKLLHQMRGYKAYGAAWSPNGSLLVIGYGDSLSVYQASDYTFLFSLQSPDEPVHELVFSPDGSLLASSSDIWHVLDRKHIYHLENSVHEVNFIPDGRMLLVGVKGWRISTGSEAAELISPLERSPRTQYAQENVALSPDGRLLAWGNQDGVSIWGTNTPSSTPDRNLYLVQSGDTYLTIAEKSHLNLHNMLDLNGLSCDHVIYTGQALNLSLENVENYALMQLPILSKGISGQLEKIKDVPDATCAKETGVLSFSPDGLSLASGGNLWRLTRNSLLILETDISFQSAFEEGVRTPSPSMVFSPDGKLVAIRSGKVIKLYELSSGRLVNILEGHTDLIAGLAFSKDSKMLASGSSTNEKAIYLWNVSDGSLVRTITGVAAKKILFSPDGNLLMTSWEDDTIRFWNVADGTRLNQLLSGIMGRAVVAPDGNSIAYIACVEQTGIQCTNQVINIYKIESGLVYRTLPGLQDLVQDVIWSPDGAHILVASDYAILEWDVETSTLVRKFDPGPKERRTIENLYLNPGNDLLLAVAGDDTIYFWDYITGSLRFSQRILHDYLSISPLDNLIAFINAGRVSLWWMP